MFVDSFDKLIIARGNFACGELERALQYLELYMDENKDKMQEHLPLLAEIYALLDEPDSVAGMLIYIFFLLFILGLSIEGTLQHVQITQYIFYFF